MLLLPLIPPKKSTSAEDIANMAIGILITLLRALVHI